MVSKFVFFTEFFMKYAQPAAFSAERYKYIHQKCDFTTIHTGIIPTHQPINQPDQLHMWESLLHIVGKTGLWVNV